MKIKKQDAQEFARKMERELVNFSRLHEKKNIGAVVLMSEVGHYVLYEVHVLRKSSTGIISHKADDRYLCRGVTMRLYGLEKSSLEEHLVFKEGGLQINELPWRSEVTERVVF